MMVGPRRATGISRTMARGFLRCGTDGIGKSIRKSAACPKDRIRLPCKGSIPRVPEMITHGMKVGGRKATRRTRFWVTFSVTMLLNPFSMLQLVRRRRTWLKTVRKWLGQTTLPWPGNGCAMERIPHRKSSSRIARITWMPRLVTWVKTVSSA